MSDARKEIETFMGPQFADSFKRFGEIMATSKAHTYGMILSKLEFFLLISCYWVQNKKF